jgi:hypothetical protein
MFVRFIINHKNTKKKISLGAVQPRTQALTCCGGEQTVRENIHTPLPPVM